VIWLLIRVALLVTLLLLWLVAARHDPGHLLIHYQGWSVETTLSFALLLVLLFSLLLHALLTLGNGVAHLPRRISDWRDRRRLQRQQVEDRSALYALIEGRWSQARRVALAARERGEAVDPLARMVAATASQQLGEQEAWSTQLHALIADHPQARDSARLLQARGQLELGNAEQALTILQPLAEPPPAAIALRGEAFAMLHEWGRLRSLLPALQESMAERRYRQLEYATWCGLIERYAEPGDPAALRACWESMAPRLRDDERLRERFFLALSRCELVEDVEQLLRQELERRWSARLADLYSQLDDSPAARRLEWLEERLLIEQENPATLLACGRCALQARLWGRARSYLEAAVGRQPDLTGYRLLARTLEEIGDQAALQQCRRDALDKIGRDAPHDRPWDLELTTDQSVQEPV
jgi:HemY protein